MHKLEEHRSATRAITNFCSGATGSQREVQTFFSGTTGPSNHKVRTLRRFNLCTQARDTSQRNPSNHKLPALALLDRSATREAQTFFSGATGPFLQSQHSLEGRVPESVMVRQSLIKSDENRELIYGVQLSPRSICHAVKFKREVFY